ncbi:hypothetical protein ACTXT7_016699 [Hymenolepis weldensis]
MNGTLDEGDDTNCSPPISSGYEYVVHHSLDYHSISLLPMNANFKPTNVNQLEMINCIFGYCVTHFCQKQYEENEFAVQVFRWRLMQRPSFRCFVSSELHGHEALMHKFHRASTVTYGIALPVFVCLIALLALLLLWYFDRCRVWYLQDEQGSFGRMVAQSTVIEG